MIPFLMALALAVGALPLRPRAAVAASYVGFAASAGLLNPTAAQAKIRWRVVADSIAERPPVTDSTRVYVFEHFEARPIQYWARRDSSTVITVVMLPNDQTAPPAPRFWLAYRIAPWAPRFAFTSDFGRDGCRAVDRFQVPSARERAIALRLDCTGSLPESTRRGGAPRAVGTVGRARLSSGEPTSHLLNVRNRRDQCPRNPG